MLDFGNFKARDCGNGVGRRSFLKTASALPFAFGAGYGGIDLEAARKLGDRAKAKSVILLWLWGGPSHLDTFDPKPDAPMEYRGPFGVIPTKTDGLQVTELLPQLAKRSHLYSVIRSMQTTNGGHPGAGTVGLTGFEENPTVHPNFGSIMSKHRGRSGALPPFFYLGQGIPRDLPRRIEGYGGGTLGKAYDPFLVSCSENGKIGIPTLDLLPGMTPNRIHNRRGLMAQLDDTSRKLDGDGVDGWNQAHHAAYGLLTDPKARDSFDLTTESQSTRDAYGQTSFGQSCLLARRLVETGVPYVQVNWSEYVETFTPNGDFGWDTHIYNFELLQDRHCPIFDRAFSALLDDMNSRGLLEDTLVIATGEFGRTPKISNRAAREHHKDCYFSVWAGAGIQPGRVIGESDKRGEHPVTEPITPLMMGTTIAELSGIGARERAEMKVLDGGKVINELL